MISLLFTGALLLQYERKIAIARNGLPEDQRLRDQTAQRVQQVARIWKLLQ